MRFKLWLWAFICLIPAVGWPRNIVVIQGNYTAFGRNYFSGFSASVNETILAFQYEPKAQAALIKKIKELRPNLLVTIGDVPLARFVREFPSTPFIVGDYYSERLADMSNVVVMESQLPVEIAIDLGLQAVGPKKTIGTMYDPKHSTPAFNALVQHAAKKGMRVVSVKVDSPGDVTGLVQAFAGKIDLFLYLRDATIGDSNAAQAIGRFSVQHKIPVISLQPDDSDQTQALLTTHVDPIALGQQAWNVAKIILTQKKIPQMPEQLYNTELIVRYSLSTAQSLGINQNDIFTFLRYATDKKFDLRL